MKKKRSTIWDRGLYSHRTTNLSLSWKPRSESSAKAWLDLLTRPIDEAARNIQSLVPCEAGSEQNSRVLFKQSVPAKAAEDAGCAPYSWQGGRRPHMQLFAFT